MVSHVLSRCFRHLEQRVIIINNTRPIHGIFCGNINISTENRVNKFSDASRDSLCLNHNLNCTFRRWKHNRSSKKGQHREEDEDLEDKDDEEMQLLAHGKNNKIITPSTSSMRIDAVVKAALGIARSQADVALYESKIRVNSEKVLKKGYQVAINDVIDFIVGPSPKNPKFTIVTRITILDAKLNVDTIKLKILREKNLVVDDYMDSYKLETSD
ncbi:uncharacterized protein [Fopius arisanus]|uniref:RNA-binding S4 domain-containing protein n=1 Tax=Fopius arisanus TaxID=64838 RepID=A0A9R1U4C7_9HYME|nr:PREDICTED: uncharacterized protein LOC105268629 [Fopius arisanus]